MWRIGSTSKSSMRGGDSTKSLSISSRGGRRWEWEVMARRLQVLRLDQEDAELEGWEGFCQTTGYPWT